MKYFDQFYVFLRQFLSPEEIDTINSHIKNSFANSDWIKWEKVLNALPGIKPSQINLNSDSVSIGINTEIDKETKAYLQNLLKELMPWRKGPFNIFGINIDTEWRSDWKWNRLKDHIKSLEHKNILDIGSGNGYFALRMIGAGAKSVIGIDSYLLYTAQFLALKKFLPDIKAWVVPVRFEHFPKNRSIFDTVFSMGVIYHQKDPLKHLSEIYGLLKKGGELILETLIIDEKYGKILQPEDRYAKMRNVKNIPSVSLLREWLSENGFSDIKLVDISVTTTEEQRRTDWMKYESLTDFLDANDNTKTIEGYPAPKRAILIANK